MSTLVKMVSPAMLRAAPMAIIHCSEATNGVYEKSIQCWHIQVGDVLYNSGMSPAEHDDT